MDEDKLFEILRKTNENRIGPNIALVQVLDLFNKRYFVALVYQNSEATMLKTLVTKCDNKDEALGKAIEYFANETKGYGLVMKSVTSPNKESANY